MTAELHVVIPGLCGPFPKNIELPVSDALTQLAALLAKAERQPSADNFYTQLAQCLLLQSPLPAAALALSAHGSDSTDKFCMQISPVHLQADIDHAILYDEFALALEPHEKERLRTELNRHFLQDGIELCVSASGDWSIAVDDAANLSTTALHDVVGRNVNFYLPSGEDAAGWKRFLTEAQMLMHMSAVNTERESQGKLVANSVWLWGQGRLDDMPRECEFDYLYGDCDLLRGIASYYQCGYDDITRLHDTTIQGNHVLLCDSRLLSAASYADHERWLDDLQQLMQQFLLPLVAKVKPTQAQVFIYPCAGNRYALQASNWRKQIFSIFDKKPEPMDVICRDA
jgi:hypothetical protein